MKTMWMAELASRTGLPVATVKYYLRQGLLHAGEATGATRARYDESHVRRLRLIRALTEVAGLRLEEVRSVLEAVDDPDRSWHEAVGSAHTRLGGDTQPGRPGPSPGRDREAAPAASAASCRRVDALLERHGWHVGNENVNRAALARALDALEALGHAPSDELLDTYARAAQSIAAAEVGAVAADRAAAVEQVVVGTLLLEPALLAIRRMAQEAESFRTRR